MVDKYCTSIYFTNLLSKSSPPSGGTNSFFRAARIYSLQTNYVAYDAILMFETSVFLENLAKGTSFLGEARMALIRLCLLACLHDQKKWLFWRASFYPANQSNLKSFLKALIGDWLEKSRFCFNHVNRLYN